MMLAEQKNTFETGNVILDALLNDKQIAASKINATIVFGGVMPEDLLRPLDVCIIFGNALDNAIEACANNTSNQKLTIYINSSFKNGFLFIKIENPVVTKVKIVNNVIATTKIEKHLHGMGLRSISASIKKYSGEMKLSQSNGIFCLEIDLDFNIKR